METLPTISNIKTESYSNSIYNLSYIANNKYHSIAKTRPPLYLSTKIPHLSLHSFPIYITHSQSKNPVLPPPSRSNPRSHADDVHLGRGAEIRVEPQLWHPVLLPVLIVNLQRLALPFPLVQNLRYIRTEAFPRLGRRRRGRGVTRRQDVLGEASKEVTRRIVVGDDVDLAVAVARHADAELGRVAPHDLREVAGFQGRRLLAVHVLRLLRVPEVWDLLVLFVARGDLYGCG